MCVALASLFADATVADDRAPVHGYEIVQVYPHARDAFTQGLLWQDGYLYESTGLHGASSVRQVDLTSGEILRQIGLDRRLFGEGLAAWEDTLIQLTLRRGIAIVYDRETFQVRKTLRYPGEGWGLTHDGRQLIMSDGSASLRLLDPETFEQIGSLAVHDGGIPVKMLNELEYINGEIFANIWKAERIARISPETGQVLGWVDLTGLYPPEDRPHVEAVLNGIAYDDENERIFVTGKLWSKLFEIRIVPAP